MAWSPRTSASGIQYARSYYWNRSINPNATIDLCLPNCTTYSYGRVLEGGFSTPPVTVIRNANQWHNYVNTAGGWTLINFTDASQLQPGDILEWSGNDVCVCEYVNGDEIYLSGSFYTERPQTFGSLQEVSDWGQTLGYRWFHYWPLSSYYRAGIGSPTHIIRNTSEDPDPPIPPEPEDQSLIVALSGTIINRRKRKNVKIIL